MTLLGSAEVVPTYVVGVGVMPGWEIHHSPEWGLVIQEMGEGGDFSSFAEDFLLNSFPNPGAVLCSFLWMFCASPA